MKHSKIAIQLYCWKRYWQATKHKYVVLWLKRLHLCENLCKQFEKLSKNTDIIDIRNMSDTIADEG